MNDGRKHLQGEAGLAIYWLSKHWPTSWYGTPPVSSRRPSMEWYDTHDEPDTEFGKVDDVECFEYPEIGRTR